VLEAATGAVELVFLHPAIVSKMAAQVRSRVFFIVSSPAPAFARVGYSLRLCQRCCGLSSISRSYLAVFTRMKVWRLSSPASSDHSTVVTFFSSPFSRNDIRRRVFVSMVDTGASRPSFL
jgi:hypothetical protein